MYVLNICIDQIHIKQQHAVLLLFRKGAKKKFGVFVALFSLNLKITHNQVRLIVQAYNRAFHIVVVVKLQ